MTTTTIIGDYAFRTICERHQFRPFVGKSVQYALDEYECPACVAEYDGRRGGPCCSEAATTCCGHEYDGEDAEPELVPGAYSLLFPSTVNYRFNHSGKMDALTGLTIDSPDYCNGQSVPF